MTVVISLYRSLLRSARHLESTAAQRGLSLYSEVRKFEAGPLGATAETPSQAVQLEFRSAKDWKVKSDVQERVGIAFRALRQARARLDQLASPDWTPRDSNIRFFVGQIVRHRKYNYRGVIISYDSNCRATETWKKNNKVSGLSRQQHQPFYRLLVDQRDDPRRFRSYCAEENLEDEIEHWDMGGVGEGPGGSGGGKEPLDHPEILDYFSSWSPLDGRYCLGEELRGDFPED